MTQNIQINQNQQKGKHRSDRASTQKISLGKKGGVGAHLRTPYGFTMISHSSWRDSPWIKAQKQLRN